MKKFIYIIIYIFIFVVNGISQGSSAQILNSERTKQIMHEYIEKNINIVLFRNSNGEPDEEFISINEKDHEVFIGKANVFIETFKKIISSLEDKEYTQSFVEKLKSDTLEMMCMSKQMFLMDKKEMEEACNNFAQESSKLISQTKYAEDKIKEIKIKHDKIVDDMLQSTLKIIQTEEIYCDKDLISKNVIRLVKELASDPTQEEMLMQKYLNDYMVDVSKQVHTKIINDFKRMAGNLYYGNSALEKMSTRKICSSKEIDKFVRDSLTNSDDQIVFGMIKGDLYSMIYLALEYALAMPEEKGSLQEQVKAMQRMVSPNKEYIILLPQN